MILHLPDVQLSAIGCDGKIDENTSFNAMKRFIVFINNLLKISKLKNAVILSFEFKKIITCIDHLLNIK